MTWLAILLGLFPSAHADRAHHKHRRHRPRPMSEAIASWYEDAGSTASGRHYRYGFASLMFGSNWGQRVRFCYHHRCLTGRLDDHGPYVAGREFDLNQNIASALGFSGVDTIRYRVINH